MSAEDSVWETACGRDGSVRHVFGCVWQERVGSRGFLVRLFPSGRPSYIIIESTKVTSGLQKQHLKKK